TAPLSCTGSSSYSGFWTKLGNGKPRLHRASVQWVFPLPRWTRSRQTTGSSYRCSRGGYRREGRPQWLWDWEIGRLRQLGLDTSSTEQRRVLWSPVRD